MPMANLNLKVIIGSTRPNRFCDKPANWIFDLLKKKDGVDAEVLDLRDYPLPYYNEPISPSNFNGNYPSPEVEKWARKIEEADGFIIVTPEYNHGTSAVLKNSLDYVYDPWNNKPVGFVSYGSVGGGRAIEHLRLVSIELQMAPIRQGVYILSPWRLMEDGKLKEGALDAFAEGANKMINQLIWWADALKAARSAV